jgi:hypothetical protein
MFLGGPLSKARHEVINCIRRLGERPRDDGEIELLKARTRSIIDLVLYFEGLLEGNDERGSDGRGEAPQAELQDAEGRGAVPGDVGGEGWIVRVLRVLWEGRRERRFLR